jgi:hypothetical protein
MRKCNELLETRFPILTVTVPLLLLVTDILYLTKPIQVTEKIASYATKELCNVTSPTTGYS